MNFLTIHFLELFILTVSKINTQAKTIHQNIDIKGDAGLSKVVTEEIQQENQLARPRRSVVSATIPSCYESFFASSQPPSGFRLNHANIRYICQQVPGNTVNFYSTMFDIDYRIPIYSAYVVKQAQAALIGTVDRIDKWRKETGIGNKPASDQAYAGQTTYAKGHLLPAEAYSFDDNAILSTFTYTNAVPQKGRFNSGVWAQYESKIRDYAKFTCSTSGGDLYLIPGISEAKSRIQGECLQQSRKTLTKLKTSGDAVSIPKSMWTAGCCIVPARGAVGAFAVIGK
ncbi:Endonuclease domain containing 1 [Desmophyllum pertusum]|uniref:Endonuclease domain containing 1 n=1 Tax=Desmophyllum pertusum TaxID=174260 RepID=A0A9X0D9Q0_9CNID|nr:Endonuclease domain containing 1 [Desmophyllum pertusum]